jgi:aspartyl-tRNA(Asn)/glutamyl-tRNA(Gln) amidotransferase subunit A
MKIGLRDNICTKETKTTCGSKLLENFISPYNASVVEKLNEKKVDIEKVNIKEFGIEEDEYVAEAFEKQKVDAVVLSDWNGEIARNSINGRVGIKPSFGLVSRYGVVTIAPSLEQIGIVGKDINTASEVLDIIKGYDKKDSGSVDEKEVKQEKKEKLKVGYIEENLGTKLQGEKINIKNLKYAKVVLDMISSAESSSNLARFDGIRYGYQTENAETWKEVYTKTRQEGFGYETKKKMISGTFFLDVENMQDYYIKSEKVRTVIKRELEEVFKTVDVIAVPNKKEYTCLANLTGRPAITAGDIAFIGKHFDEENLIAFVKTFGGDK